MVLLLTKLDAFDDKNTQPKSWFSLGYSNHSYATFQAGKTKDLNGDNWVVTLLTEEIVCVVLNNE